MSWLDWATGPLVFGWIFVLIWVPIVVISQKKTHPKALFTLFFAELWERFSFYGMRALLTLYMTKVLFEHMGKEGADTTSLGIYGAFNALLYGTPVLGGMLADRLFGFRKAVIIGGMFMALGQFTLAATIGQEVPFFVGLALLVVGNGLFKPNISSFLGTFYDQADARKDGAFTIFYMGINIGAFLSPLTCGYLGEKVGWHWGFFAAGLGICLGVVVFWRNMRVYQDKGLPPVAAQTGNVALGLTKNQLLILLACIVSIPVIATLLNYTKVTDWILIASGVGIIGYLSITSATAEDKVAGQRLLVVIVLFFFHMVFWTLFEQAGGSLTLFTDRYVNRHGIPASQFQSLNPFFIMTLAPVFSWIWIRLRKMDREPRTPMKFVLGLFQLAMGYAVIVWGASQAGEALIPIAFLAIMYLLHTTGELSLSPVGLSVVTKLAPAKVVGFVMGTWFMSIAFAHMVAVELGKLAATPAEEGAAVTAYTDVYWTWGVLVVLGSTAFLFVLSPILKKWMHGVL